MATSRVVGRAAVVALRPLHRLRGVGTVVQRLHRRALSSDAEWSVRMHGYGMVLPAASSQTWSAAVSGEYGEEAMARLRPHIRPGTAVLDVGASLGLFTVPAGLAARQVGAQVVAFEPVPGNLAFLRRNVALNGVGDVVEVRPVGLGSAPAILEMRVEGRGAGNAAVTTGVSAEIIARAEAEAGFLATARAEISTLDSQLLPPCSAMKVDVEGLELEVLAGGARLIARDRPVIYAEFNPAWLATRGYEADAPYQWAKDNGYRMFGFPSVRRRPWLAPVPGNAVLVSGPWSDGDVLLVPEER